MKIYILDASVIINGIRDLNNIGKHLRYILDNVKKGQIKLYTSPLIFFEVLNSLRYIYQDKEISLTFYEKIMQFPMEIFNFEKDHGREILKLAYQTKTTIYDSSYHFLAKLVNGIFLTCDQEYYQKAKKLGSIELLK